MIPSAELYSERAHLVALLAAAYPSCWDFSDPCTPEWPVVYVELPTGQVSWHIDPTDWWMFGGVPHNQAARWDGHTTRTKYRRITALTLQLVKAKAEAERMNRESQPPGQ